MSQQQRSARVIPLAGAWPRIDLGLNVDGMLFVDVDGDPYGDVIAMAVGVGDLHQCQLVVGCKGQDIVYGATVDGQRAGAGVEEIAQVVAAVKKLFDLQ